MIIDVYAKINLGLKVLEKKENMHALDMLCHSVDLCDTFIFSENGQVEILDETLSIDIDKFKKFILSTLNQFHLNCGLKIIKRIPLGGGLGGGTTLFVALVYFVELRFGKKLNETQMCQLASDLPFMCQGGYARVGGIGEIVEPKKPLDYYALLLGCGGVSTAEAFKLCDYTGKEDFDIAKIDELLTQSKKVEIKNDLFFAAKKLNNNVSMLEKFLSRYDMPYFMTGSGSTMVMLSKKIIALQSVLQDFTNECKNAKKFFKKIVKFVKYGKSLN